MKKVLSFVLVLAMLLGCFSMVFAASFSDVATGDDHEEAINVLSSLGVVSGYTDGTFKPEKVVTRAEMAAFIINALFGEDKQITQRATNFSDVTAAHWASGFVDYANTLSVISGYTDGTFKPDQVVNYNEAITMIVKALGYNDDCLTGTWPASYVNKAKALGLLTDVDGLGTVGAVRGDIAQLVYNALDCPIGTVNKDGEWVANLGKKLSNGNYAADTMLARLGGYQDPNAVVITDADVENAVIDVAEYLGAYAKVVRDEEGGDIIGVYEVKSEFITGEFDGEKKFDKYTVDDGAYLKYKETTDKGTTTKDAKQFLNGKTGELTVDRDGNTTYTIAAKVSGKHITAIYSIQTWKEDAVAKMTDAQVKELSKNKLLGKSFALDKNDEIDTDSFTLVGADSLDDIKKGDVVTVYCNNGKITKVTVGTEVVTGKITKINGTKLTVNGTEYKTGSVKNLTEAEINNLSFKVEYNLFLDNAGKVRFIEETEDDSESFYGVVMDAALSGTAWASETAGRQVKLFTQEGKEVVLPIKAKLAADSAIYFTDEKGRNTVANSNKVIEYTLNEDGEIATAVEVAATTAEKVSKKLTVDGYYFADDAVIFVISGNPTDGYEYAIAKAADYADKTVAAKYDLYKSQVCVMVITKASSEALAMKGFYLSEVKVGTDKYEVTFLVDGEEKTYNTTEKSGLTKTNQLGFYSVGEDKITEAEFKAVGESYTVTTEASIKGNTLYLDDKPGVAIDAKAQVYVYNVDDKELTVGSAADLANIGEGDTVYGYDLKDDDGKTDSVYEIVVIWDVE